MRYCTQYSRRLAPQYDLEHRVSIFVAEEIRTWFAMSKQEPRGGSLRDFVNNAIDSVTRKARLLSCKYEREKVRCLLLSLPQPVPESDPSVPLWQPPSGVTPVCQSLLELILSAASPANLAACDPQFVPAL